MRPPTHLCRGPLPTRARRAGDGPGLALPREAGTGLCRSFRVPVRRVARSGSAHGTQVWTTCRKHGFRGMPRGSLLVRGTCLRPCFAIWGSAKFFVRKYLHPAQCRIGRLVVIGEFPRSSIPVDFRRCGKTVRKPPAPRIPFREFHLRRNATRKLHVAGARSIARVPSRSTARP